MDDVKGVHEMESIDHLPEPVSNGALFQSMILRKDFINILPESFIVTVFEDNIDFVIDHVLGQLPHDVRMIQFAYKGMSLDFP